MNTLIENTLLKMGVGLQTMGAPKVPAMLKNLFKTQTPLEKLNQERIAMGYDPLTQSEWLATAGTAGGVVATTSVAATCFGDDNDLFHRQDEPDYQWDTMYSSWSENVYNDD